LAHLQNVGELLAELFSISTVELEIFGNMSEELQKAVAPFKPKVYSFYEGL
jgi:hypothetical protein